MLVPFRAMDDGGGTKKRTQQGSGARMHAHMSPAGNAELSDETHAPPQTGERDCMKISTQKCSGATGGSGTQPISSASSRNGLVAALKEGSTIIVERS